MSNNHLIIGLGGTGGKTIKNLRKAINEEFRCNDPNKSDFKPTEEIYIKYLYIDSQKKDLAVSENWKTQDDIGSDIGLNKESLLPISENNLSVRLKDPQNYPVTHRYIGKEEEWSEIFSSMNISETAGGQMRRLGVALFEPECTNFVSHVQQLTRQLEASNKGVGIQGTQFHVCAGLAGGTGSGSFLHVIAQLRAIYPNSKDYPIYLYVLLPEENSPWASNGEKTNYYANGYAALQELNAYLVSDSSETPNKGGPLFAPIDLTGQTQRFENASTKSTKLKDRLQGCFILDNVNESNIKVPVQEVTQLFAQLLYQRMFLLNELSDQQQVTQALSLENISMSDEHNGSNENIKLRSVRWQTFGVKKIVIPDEEIREHLAACFAEQSILQMLYNNWMAGDASYRATQKTYVFSDFVPKESNRRMWKLANNQITLSEGLLENETKENWKDIQDEWFDIANEVKNKAWATQEENGRDVRLDVLEKSFKDHYEKTFRSSGVEVFYNSKQDDLGRENTHVTEIVNTMQSWMLLKWQDGEYGLVDLKTMLSDLTNDTKKRIDTINERIEKLEKDSAYFSSLIQKNKNSWANVGVVGNLLGKKEALFESQVELLRQLNETETLNKAWRFAQKLLQRCLVEFRDNIPVVFEELISHIKEEQQFFMVRHKATCNDDSSDIKKNLIKFYEPDKVKEFCSSLLSSETKQKEWAQRSRSKFVSTAETNKRDSSSKEKDFAALRHHGNLRNILEQVARDNSQQAHDDERSMNNRLIGANIVSRLAGKYQNEEEKLRSYIREIVTSTQTFMRFNQSEINTAPKEVIAVVLPICEEVNSFRDRLVELFKSNEKAGLEICVVPSSRNRNQISLVSFKYGFPLRYLQPVQFLKEKYDLRLQQNPARAKLEVHIEDHPANRLPELFRSRPGEIGDRILPWYQLAIGLDLFELIHNHETNKKEWNITYIKPCKENETPIPKITDYPYEFVSFLVESNVDSSISNVELQKVLNSTTEDKVFNLEEAVNQILKSEAYKKAIARDALKAKLVAQLNLVLSKRNKNSKDIFYIKLEESTKTSIALIDGLI